MTGDLGAGANKGMVTCMRLKDGSDVAALVKTGAGASDWSSVVEATKNEICTFDRPESVQILLWDEICTPPARESVQILLWNEICTP